MRKLLIPGFLTLLLLSSCSTIGDIEIVEKEDGTKQVVRSFPPSETGRSASPLAKASPEKPPLDGTWISPGKIQVSNFEPGKRAEWFITIHNGSCDSKEFSVSYRVPPNISGEYLEGIQRASEWISIKDPVFIMAPKETRDVLVVLEMPEDEEVFASHWEFWVAVKPTSSAFIQTELATRWLVWMK